MKKIFKSFKISHFIPNLFIGLAYPVIKSYATGNSLIIFSDTCFIVSLLFIFFSIFYSLSNHGDFDVISYIAKRVVYKEKAESFDVYKKNSEYKRKDSFNYPLFTGIIILIIAYISAQLV